MVTTVKIPPKKDKMNLSKMRPKPLDGLYRPEGQTRQNTTAVIFVACGFARMGDGRERAN